MVIARTSALTDCWSTVPPTSTLSTSATPCAYTVMFARVSRWLSAGTYVGDSWLGAAVVTAGRTSVSPAPRRTASPTMLSARRTRPPSRSTGTRGNRAYYAGRLHHAQPRLLLAHRLVVRGDSFEPGAPYVR